MPLAELRKRRKKVKSTCMLFRGWAWKGVWVEACEGLCDS